MTQDAFDAAISAAVAALSSRSDDDARRDCERAIKVFQHVILCIEQNARDDLAEKLSTANVHPMPSSKN